MAIFRRGPPPNVSVEYRWDRQKHDLSQYLAPSCAVNGSIAKCNTFSCDEPWQVDDTSRWYAAEFVDGGKRRQSVYDKKSQRYAEDNRTAYNCKQW